MGATDGGRVGYERAFAAIDADPAQALVAVEASDGAVVGTMQLTLIPGLSRGGAALVQLRSDARRVDARRFSERLGFAASHVGFKMFL